MPFVDLSHPVEDGMTTYPGLPAPEIGCHLSFEGSAGVYAAGTEFQIGMLSMVANTGTYLDTPNHRYRDGWDLADLPLDKCADLPTTVVRCDGANEEGAIHAGAFEGLELAGRAVLLHTGWDRHWRTEQYGDPTHPYLTEDGAEALVAAGAALVGIDSVNIDATTSGERPAHSLLLAAGIPIVEHLTRLEEVADGARFSAVPVAVRGLATFPVRAFAQLP